MDHIKFSLDREELNAKPYPNEIVDISRRIGKQLRKMSRKYIYNNIKEIGENGRTFCPATFIDGKRNTENFEQLQLLVLDFDSGISFKDVKERADEYDIPILFAYETLSGKEDRFRTIFLNDVSVTDQRAAKAMLHALTTIFPEADPTSKDISKMYYGGKKLLHYDHHNPEINIESLFRNMTLYLKNKHGDTHYKNKIIEFSNKTGIALNSKNFPDVTIAEIDGNYSSKISPNSIILSMIGENLPNKNYLINMWDSSTKNSANKQKQNIHNQYRSSVMKDMSAKERVIKVNLISIMTNP